MFWREIVHRHVLVSRNFFRLNELKELRSGNEEFLVTVVGSNGDKDFKVKRKHFQALFGGKVTIDPSFPVEPTDEVTTTAKAPTTPVSKDDSFKIARQTESPATEMESGTVHPATQPAQPGSLATAKLPAQPAKEAFLGAGSNEKPRVRRDGVIVSEVTPGGPADEAGIRPSDFILALGDHYVFTVEDFIQAIHQYQPGSKVNIRYRRYATIYDTYVVMGSAPESAPSTH